MTIFRLTRNSQGQCNVKKLSNENIWQECADVGHHGEYMWDVDTENEVGK